MIDVMMVSPCLILVKVYINVIELSHVTRTSHISPTHPHTHTH